MGSIKEKEKKKKTIWIIRASLKLPLGKSWSERPAIPWGLQKPFRTYYHRVRSHSTIHPGVVPILYRSDKTRSSEGVVDFAPWNDVQSLVFIKSRSHDSRHVKGPSPSEFAMCISTLWHFELRRSGTTASLNCRSERIFSVVHTLLLQPFFLYREEPMTKGCSPLFTKSRSNCTIYWPGP